MFARTLAFGALALLLTVPAAQAGSLNLPAGCAMGYQAAPYNGPLAQVQTGLDNLAGCTYHTHDAPEAPIRILFVPYLPLPELGIEQPSADLFPNCVLIRDEPNGEPHAQVIQQGQCFSRTPPAEPGPEPLAYHAKRTSAYPEKPIRALNNQELFLDTIAPFVTTMPAQTDDTPVESLIGPMYCAQVYPYSLVCTVPNTAIEIVVTLLKA